MRIEMRIRMHYIEFMHEYDPDAPKRATNLSLNESLLSAAKALDINLSRAAEQGVAAAISRKRAEQWQAENAAALESSNAFVREHGLPLARYRRF
jgi:antitoxin CcdA